MKVTRAAEESTWISGELKDIQFQKIELVEDEVEYMKKFYERERGTEKLKQLISYYTGVNLQERLLHPCASHFLKKNLMKSSISVDKENSRSKTIYFYQNFLTGSILASSVDDRDLRGLLFELDRQSKSLNSNRFDGQLNYTPFRKKNSYKKLARSRALVGNHNF